MLFGTIAAAAIAGALGVGFGSITHRQTGAIVFAFVWLLVVEPLLGIAGVQQYAPGHAIASVVEGGTQSSELLSFGAGLALSLAYVLGFAVAGTLVVKGSDVPDRAPGALRRDCPRDWRNGHGRCDKGVTVCPRGAPDWPFRWSSGR